MRRINNLAVYLAYAGAMPFLLCAVFFLFDEQATAIRDTVKDALSAYGLIIAVFMSGVHWGQHLDRTDRWSVYLPIASNVNAVLLWGLYLLLPFKVLMGAFAVSFALLLLIDRRLFHDGVIALRYYHTRCTVTILVIACLIIAGLCA